MPYGTQGCYAAISQNTRNLPASDTPASEQAARAVRVRLLHPCTNPECYQSTSESKTK